MSAVPAVPGALRLGAHLNGGVKGAAEHARRIGLDGSRADGAGGPIQIWSRNPSAWRSGAHEAKVIDAFRAACATYHLGPVFVHGIYLMNFASPDDALWERSIEAMVDQLQTGAALGAGAVILHPGAGKDQSLEVALDRCAVGLRRVLEQTAALPQRPLDRPGDLRRGRHRPGAHLRRAARAPGSPGRRPGDRLLPGHGPPLGQRVRPGHGGGAAGDHGGDGAHDPGAADRRGARQRLQGAPGIAQGPPREHRPGLHRRGGLRPDAGAPPVAGPALGDGGAWLRQQRPGRPESRRPCAAWRGVPSRP